MRRLIPALAALALLTAACGGSSGRAATDTGAAAPSLPESRLDLPTFDLDRFETLLAGLEGTPVVVNIWASWCGPCRVEGPHLAAAARDYEGRIQFLGVDILDNREAARDFILEFDWPYPSVFDPDGSIRDGLGFLGQPVTFIVDGSGERVFEWTGAISDDVLRTEIDKVVG
jgi:thiol-disulfide isomerase/thioredoxin